MVDAPSRESGTWNSELASRARPPLTYLSGIQALVRLPMLQRVRDAAAGLDTAGFISGYRGSPLGGLDQSLWKAEKQLAEHRIHFKPG
jgi:indolepyruvate ferredoxin oxidoreductase